MLSRQVLSRQARHYVPASGAALSVQGVNTFLSSFQVNPRFSSMLSEANLAPMHELSEARRKLRQVLDEYRQANFAQTLFSRFVHEMITVTDSNHDGKISLQEMRSMLKKIGADSSISDEDLRAVFDELGHDEDGESLIYADEIETILTQPSKQ